MIDIINKSIRIFRMLYALSEDRNDNIRATRPSSALFPLTSAIPT